MKFRYLILLPLFFSFYQCTTGDSRSLTKINLHVFATPGSKIYLTRVPYIDERDQIMDSAIAKNAKDSIVFTVLRANDRLYEIRIKGNRGRCYFIPDAPLISVRGNGFNGKFVVAGSPATASLEKFHQDQSELAHRWQSAQRIIDSLLKTPRPDRSAIASWQEKIADSLVLMRTRNLHYADTVGSPAAFMAVYNTIDFDGEGRKELKPFILHNAERFPHSLAVQKLKKEVLDMLSIFEGEFNVGNRLPPILLPDVNGRLFSTAELKGKYYLIDFWSTWCSSCSLYNQYKQELSTKFSPDKLQLVSVALEDNREAWIARVRRRTDHSLQLIDENMWRGVAARTLKFDSIPFNFLVSPEGRVLAKAIPPDSLVTVSQRMVK